MTKNKFASSDEETTEKEQTPFELSWLSLVPVNYAYKSNIFVISGCKFKNIQRNLFQNVEEIKRLDIEDVFLFCTTSKLTYHRTPTLIQEYHKQGFAVHQYPFLDGDVPELDTCHQILEDLLTCMDNRRKTLTRCYGGLGRSCIIAACRFLQMDEKTTPEEAIHLVRAARGPGAIQTIKQYNFVYAVCENMSHRHPDNPCPDEDALRSSTYPESELLTFTFLFCFGFFNREEEDLNASATYWK
ncbi:LOW QUALITY PROTEIN: cyclin-dependent kinase inhibitor 3 [Ranitomeya imitator]|uniref:LOW QUALITY PROTEIN: cyclin-dependent kinase inhibitor 3 n=1 Tax=Ranitomeya imitator TaxID=111125 RepID=UPI0037E84FD5